MKNKLKRVFINLITLTYLLLQRRSRRFTILMLMTLFLLAFFLFPLKKPLFNDSYATVLTDREKNLLGAYISSDEQWRFPPLKKVPEKFEKCIITFEDRKFYYHPGIDPLAVARAVYLNYKAKKVVSGASTISMQVIRLARKGKARKIGEKLIEAVLALKLELFYSKKEILALYASHAPFGGNIVGLEAASWRYFARDIDNLSWAESALLAVLPNTPSLIHPGKNSGLLLQKRNRLLDSLSRRGIITRTECELAKEEPLPGKPHRLPQLSYHLLMRAMQEGHKGKKIVSTINAPLQVQVNDILKKHHTFLKDSQIHNAAVLVIKVDTGEVAAYGGNTPGTGHGKAVDIITAQRSPGSLLKPVLYAFALNEGMILPDQLLPDIPLVYEGFNPRNFGKDYEGVIAADRALAKSLNVPFVYLLREYGYARFYHRLEQTGLSFARDPAHYGLTLILGGSESSLWNLTALYAGMGRVLKESLKGRYRKKEYFENSYLAAVPRGQGKKTQGESGAALRQAQGPGLLVNLDYKKEYKKNGLLNASSIWFTFEAMKEVVRPGEDNNWHLFETGIPVAWKTGTSFGNRDAWAIGVTPEYVVGVWVGNADGEGRPEIKGVHAAAPVLFDVFDLLPREKWFKKPVDDMMYARICTKSGMTASRQCEAYTTELVPETKVVPTNCTYHHIIHLDENREFRVDSSTYPVDKMVHQKWFVLPPIMEYYYKKKNTFYKVVPSNEKEIRKVMDFIYPREAAKIFVPKELDGKPGQSIFEVAHKNPEARLFWHMDGDYLGETTHIHQMGLNPKEGEHTLVVIDEKGNQLLKTFEVVTRTRKDAI